VGTRTSVRALSGRGRRGAERGRPVRRRRHVRCAPALETLPASDWEQFLIEWRSLTEVADFDVDALDAAIRRQARRRAHYERANDPVAAAWGIVADAIESYVAWRDARTEAGKSVLSSPAPDFLPRAS
jgi:hypothetical protein